MRQKSLPKSKAKAKSKSPNKKKDSPIYVQKCDGEICCQAKTADGRQCTRAATLKIDLTRGVQSIGVKGIDCCFYCTQHAKILAISKLASFFHTYGTQIAKTVGGKNLSYDEYYAIFPEEISSSLG